MTLIMDLAQNNRITKNVCGTFAVTASVAERVKFPLAASILVATTAKLLGVAEHDIQILMSSSKLTALGDPAPNAPKWFAGVEMICLETDRDRFTRATKEISKNGRQERERRKAANPTSD
jgi:hypothetical protein